MAREIDKKTRALLAKAGEIQPRKRVVVTAANTLEGAARTNVPRTPSPNARTRDAGSGRERGQITNRVVDRPAPNRVPPVVVARDAAAERKNAALAAASAIPVGRVVRGLAGAAQGAAKFVRGVGKAKKSLKPAPRISKREMDRVVADKTRGQPPITETARKQLRQVQTADRATQAKAKLSLRDAKFNKENFKQAHREVRVQQKRAGEALNAQALREQPSLAMFEVAKRQGRARVLQGSKSAQREARADSSRFKTRRAGNTPAESLARAEAQRAKEKATGTSVARTRAFMKKTNQDRETAQKLVERANAPGGIGTGAKRIAGNGRSLPDVRERILQRQQAQSRAANRKFNQRHRVRGGNNG